MTNILVIPDLHGRTFWKEPIAHKEDFDHIVFLGDYFDPYHWESINQQDAIENFKDNGIILEPLISVTELKE